MRFCIDLRLTSHCLPTDFGTVWRAGTIVKAIKRSAPHIPIAAVVTSSAVKGIEFGAYSLPPEVDWIGYDNCALFRFI